MKNIVILMFAVAIAYVERSAIAHAVPFIIGSGTLSVDETSIVLSAFGIGYVIGLPLSALILSKFGFKRTLGLIMIGWAISGMWFAFGNGFVGYALSRFTLGLSEAPLFPMFVAYVSSTSGQETRSTKIGAIEMCSYFGMAAAGPVTVLLARSVGWSVAYASISIVALIAAMLSFAYFKDIAPAVRKEEDYSHRRFKWSSALLFVAIGFLCYNFCKTFYSTWMPSLLNKHYKYPSEHVAIISFWQAIAAPFASLLFAYISGKLLTRFNSLIFARLFLLGIGFTGAVMIAASIYLPTSADIIVAASFVSLIATSALIWNTVPDLVPNEHVAYAAGVVNGIANIGSIVSPLVIGPYIKWAPNIGVLPVAAAAALAFVSFLIAYNSHRKLMGNGI